MVGVIVVDILVELIWGKARKGVCKMIDIINILSKYIFLIIILYFIYLSCAYVLSERNIKYYNRNHIIKAQFLCVLSYVALATGIYCMYFDKLTTIKYFMVVFAYLIGFKIIARYIYKDSCRLMISCVLFLLSVSFVFLYRINVYLAYNQLKYAIIASVIIVCIPYIFRYIKGLDKLTYLYMVVGIVIIALPFLFAERDKGALNWVTIGGFSFQPSEFAKVFYIFYLASFFSKPINIKRFVIVSGTSAVFVIMLVLQNDLGGSLILFMMYMTMLFVATGSKVLFLSGLAGASVAAFLAYKVLYHVQVRVAIWQDPWEYPLGIGYQILQSLFAIGSHGFWGSGLNRGYPNFVPVVESDMIFAGISEEFGGLFAICIIVLYIIIFYRGMNIGLRSNDLFRSLLAVGVTAMFSFQTFLIIGGVIKLIPLTGVTMPFVSYGGTSMFVSLIMMGVLLSININDRKERYQSQNQEDDEEYEEEIEEREKFSKEDIDYIMNRVSENVKYEDNEYDKGTEQFSKEDIDNIMNRVSKKVKYEQQKEIE